MTAALTLVAQLAGAAACIWLTLTMASAALHAGVGWRMLATALWTPVPAIAATVLILQAVTTPLLWIVLGGAVATVTAAVTIWTTLHHIERRFGR